MLTVAVYINSLPVVLKSVRNTGEREGDYLIYMDDEGKSILHKPEDGAAHLAKLLLDNYKSPEYG